jgi:hypothetical protein
MALGSADGGSNDLVLAEDGVDVFPAALRKRFQRLKDAAPVRVRSAQGSAQRVVHCPVFAVSHTSVGLHCDCSEQVSPGASQAVQRYPVPAAEHHPAMQGRSSPPTGSQGSDGFGPSTHVPPAPHQSPGPQAFSPCVQLSPGPRHATQVDVALEHR